MIFVFDTNLLSAPHTGYPNLVTNSLSADGISINSLVENHAGIAFNRKTTLNNTPVPITVESSTFNVDRVYQGDILALIRNNGTHVTFQYLSAPSTQVAFINNSSISTPDIRRKHNLGYGAGSMYFRTPTSALYYTNENGTIYQNELGQPIITI